MLFNLAFFYRILYTIKAEFLKNWELNAWFLTNNSKIWTKCRKTRKIKAYKKNSYLKKIKEWTFMNQVDIWHRAALYYFYIMVFFSSSSLHWVLNQSHIPNSMKPTQQPYRSFGNHYSLQLPRDHKNNKWKQNFTLKIEIFHSLNLSKFNLQSENS